jgi:uncharacterized membrane protein YciS (DUF1049 family)
MTFSTSQEPYLLISTQMTQKSFGLINFASGLVVKIAASLRWTRRQQKLTHNNRKLKKKAQKLNLRTSHIKSL